MKDEFDEFESKERKKCKLEHYKKINIFGESGVGKSSLISLMENYDDDNFEIKGEDIYGSNISLDSYNGDVKIVEQVTKIKIPINDNNNLFLNVYETNLDNYDSIKINLDTLLLQTECIIIMWDGSKYETFDNISNFFSTINKGMQDNKFRKTPIFLISNKSDLKVKLSTSSNSGKNIEEAIEKIKKEYKNIVFKEISLLKKDDFQDLILEIYRNISNSEKESQLNYDDPVQLVKFKYYNRLSSTEFEIYDTINEIKCVLLGHTCVGKTTFFNYFLGKKNESYVSTIGKDSLSLLAEVNKEIFNYRIEDTAGQERFLSITKSYIRDAFGILLFFDITNEESFQYIDNWISEIKNVREQCAIILVANKIDSNKDRVITKKQGLEKANQYEIKYYECSCLKGVNVNEILNEIILASFKKYKDNEESVEIQRKNSIKLNVNNQNYIEKKKKNNNYCCIIF